MDDYLNKILEVIKLTITLENEGLIKCTNFSFHLLKGEMIFWYKNNNNSYKLLINPEISFYRNMTALRISSKHELESIHVYLKDNTINKLPFENSNSEFRTFAFLFTHFLNRLIFMQQKAAELKKIYKCGVRKLDTGIEFSFPYISIKLFSNRMEIKRIAHNGTINIMNARYIGISDDLLEELNRAINVDFINTITEEE